MSSRFTRKPGATEQARRLRKDMTLAERKLWAVLRREQVEGMSFRRQHPIGPYTLDFYSPALRLAIEVDGGQHNESGRMAKDEVRTRFLASKDVKVLRFWNNDVLGNIEGVWNQIAHEVRERLTPSLTLPLSGGEKTCGTLHPNALRLKGGGSGRGFIPREALAYSRFFRKYREEPRG